MNPIASIIIPCRNAEPYIEVAILSALANRSSIEVIVIDDGSVDSTSNILASFSDRIKIFRTEGIGASEARNLGFSMSVGRYIAFLDADDFYLPGSIDALINSSASFFENQFVFGASYRWDTLENVIVPHSSRAAGSSVPVDTKSMILESPLVGCPLYPREIVASVGGFKAGLTTRQDFDFFVRVLIAGFKPTYVPVPVYVYRNHDNPERVSRRRLGANYEAMVSLYQDYLDSLALYSDRPRCVGLSEALGLSAWTTARNALRSGYVDEAKLLFLTSHSLGGDAGGSGNKMYRALCQVAGPMLTERILETLKNGFKRRPAKVR